MSDPYIGEIHMFAGNYSPKGYAECLGQIVPVQQNPELYSLLGTAYGGDGVATFGLPDLRGRLPVHAGAGPGLKIPWRRGMMVGSETVTIEASQLPAHTHTAEVSTVQGAATSPEGAMFCAVDAAAKETLYLPPDQSPPPSLTPMKETALTFAGADMPHYNLMPFLVIRFAIALAGTYPPRS